MRSGSDAELPVGLSIDHDELALDAGAVELDAMQT